MAKEVLATMDDVKVSKRVITAPPTPQTVRIYSKKDGKPLDVFPVDAKEIVAQGEYSYEAVPVAGVGENVYKPVRPETLSAIHPEATEPLDSASLTTAGDDATTVASSGPLPDTFPHHSQLEAAGFGTYAKLRKQVAKGEGWHKDVDGVGEKSVKAIEEALKEK